MSDEYEEITTERLLERLRAWPSPGFMLMAEAADEIQRLTASLAAVTTERDAAEDFRAEIVIDAFTAPDADWTTILDSLRSRIRDHHATVERLTTENTRYAELLVRAKPLLEDGGSCLIDNASPNAGSKSFALADEIRAALAVEGTTP